MKTKISLHKRITRTHDSVKSDLWSFLLKELSRYSESEIVNSESIRDSRLYKIGNVIIFNGDCNSVMGHFFLGTIRSAKRDGFVVDVLEKAEAVGSRGVNRVPAVLSWGVNIQSQSKWIAGLHSLVICKKCEKAGLNFCSHSNQSIICNIIKKLSPF